MTAADELRLTTGARRALVAHAREGVAGADGGDAVEVCGVLGGRGGVVDAARRVDNVAADPGTRYELDPAGTLAAIDDLEATGDHVGFYHSHPRGPLAPSDVDRAAATWPGYVHAIVAPAGGGNANADDHARGRDPDPDDGWRVGAWRWTGDAFAPLSVRTVDAGGE